MLSRFFWRLYVTYVLLVVVTAVGIGFLIERQLRSDLEASIEEQLMNESLTLVAGSRLFLEGRDQVELQATFVDLSARTGTRITLIRTDGAVVADSYEDPSAMENHGDRPEFLEALETGAGTARRFSETTQNDRLYAAARVDIGGRPAGVVRSSVTLNDVAAQIATMRARVMQGAGLGIFLALGIGLVVARRVTAPIADMTAVSEALRQGDYDARVRLRRSDELGRLGQNLNQLGAELTRRLARLGRQQAQLNAFLGAMQEGVVAIDVHDRVVFSNAMGRRLLHLEPGEHQLDLGQLPNGLNEVIHEVRTVGSRTRSEVTQMIDDEEIVLDARGAPFTADNENGVVLVLYDITNMRRLERIRTDFVANVSHELKTPLTSIQGYVETLLDGAIHDQKHNTRFLDKIDVQVRRLSTLVSDLLSLARIESTTLSSEIEAVDWREIIMESVARRRDPLAKRQLELQLDLPAEPLLIEAEAEALRQIVDNLLDNAINYTPEHGKIRIELQRAGYEGVLRVEDTGIGIPDAALGRIFERFYRVDKGRSRELGGTGLGLSIVRNLVHRMQGEVHVDSEVGVGSTFTVSLPRTDDTVLLDEDPLD